ncbi:hypothetical protein NMR92_001335 [Vibrio cholerae]|nr:hypothetical protein [Vibrio cholerae]EJL6642126.1 hypothetical protein [Vibrio cholerae]
MAVLPKAERLALLAQSTYGSGTGSNSKTAINSDELGSGKLVQSNYLNTATYH